MLPSIAAFIITSYLSLPLVRRWYIRRSIMNGTFLYPLTIAIGCISAKIVYLFLTNSKKIHSAFLSAKEGLYLDMKDYMKIVLEK